MVLYTATNSVSGSSAQTASLVNAAQMQVTPEMSKQDLLYVKDISGNYAIYKLSKTMLVWAPDFADSMAAMQAQMSGKANISEIPTNVSQLVNDVPYLTSAALSGYVTTSNFTWNNLSGKPVLFSGAYADLTGKPTLFSGNYNDLTNKPTIPTQNVYNAGNGIGKSGTEPTATFYVDSTKFMSIASANTEIATMQGTINGRVPQSRTLTINGTTQDLSANRTWNVGDLLSSGSYANPTWITSLAWSKITSAPAFLTAEVDGSITNEIQTLTYNAGTLSISGGNSVNIPVPTTPTYNNAPARPVNSTAYQISATRPVRVSYTVNVVTALSLLNLTGGGTVFLEISANGTSGWITINSAGISRTLSVAITLGINETTSLNIQGEVPAGYYCRLRSATTGTGSSTAFLSGQEVTY